MNILTLLRVDKFFYASYVPYGIAGRICLLIHSEILEEHLCFVRADTGCAPLE